MSYFKEKLKIESKIKKIRIVVAVIVTAILLIACIISAFIPIPTWKYRVAIPKINKRVEGEMRLHFVDVGQGDATIIELPDGKTMLIDGGNNDVTTEKNIMRYLHALKINTIDYLVVTHADSDHCGALDVVLKYKEVKNAYIPKTSANVNKEYAAFYAALQKEDCNVTYSSREVILNHDGEFPYTLSFLSPYTLELEEGEEETKENNASSAVIWLDYQGVSTLFAADAPMELEENLMRDDKLNLFSERGVQLSSTEILKVAHHGSKYSSGLEFLQYLNVKTSIISCGEKNVHGHPTQEVLTNLDEVGAKIYRTDEDGSVMISVSKTGEYYVKNIK